LEWLTGEKMLDEIKKSLLAGLGAVVLSKDKLEEITQRLVDQSKLSKEEAQKLHEELLASGERQWSQLESSVSEAIKKGVKSLDIGSKTEVENLRKQVAALTKKVAALEATVEGLKES
jgi:polyhydroxyalkanoate synthesis regulator phasin